MRSPNHFIPENNMSQNIEITIFDESEAPTYTGRLLGFLDDTQFTKLVKHKELRSKMLTAETIQFVELYDRASSLAGKRLVAGISRRDQTAIHKTLFISARIEGFSYSTPKEVSLNIGNKGDWIIVKAIKKD